MIDFSATNPFLGPAPFPRGKALYGRDEETSALFHLLLAHRVVLLHSPSGAGKSSLIEAGLLPRLRQEGFDVWRTIRLNLDPQTLGVPAANRYLASTLASLEEQLPEAKRRPLEELVAAPFSEYLETRPKRRGASEWKLLVFDQFEEILTVNPVDKEAKRQFFAELGGALVDGKFWALFTLREDYLAALAPYRDLLPTRLAYTFRLDLLGREAAEEVLGKSAAEGGRSFPARAELVADLAKTLVQVPPSLELEKVAGPYVEPVHLQVVALRLWQAMPADKAAIEAEDLARFAKVDDALADFYTESLAQISSGDRLLERRLRDFFDQQLMTPSGLRGQVQNAGCESLGITFGHLEGLLGKHLIRAERRSGATWYELSHDRLLAPIREANARWREEHLSVLEQRAELWVKSRRSAGLLLEGKDLALARSWAAGQAELAPAEAELLAQSERARRERRLRRALLAAAVFFLLGVMGLYAKIAKLEAEKNQQIVEAERDKATAERDKAKADRDKAEAEQEAAESRIKTELERSRAEASEARERDAKERAEEQRTLAQALGLVDKARDLAPGDLDDQAKALLLALTAIHLQPDLLQARRALFELLGGQPGMQGLFVAGAKVFALALAGDGEELAVATAKEVLRFDSASGRVRERVALEGIKALTYCPGDLLVAGSEGAEIHVLPRALPTLKLPGATGLGEISRLSCAAGLLVSGESRGKVRLWEVEGDRFSPRLESDDLGFAVVDLAISPERRVAAIAAGDRVAHLLGPVVKAAGPLSGSAATAALCSSKGAGELLAISFAGESLRALTRQGGLLAWSPTCPAGEEGRLLASEEGWSKVSAAGADFAGWSKDGKLGFLAAEGKEVRLGSLPFAPDALTAMAGSLAIASPTGTLALFGLQGEGSLQQELIRPQDAIEAMTLSPATGQLVLAHARGLSLVSLDKSQGKVLARADKKGPKLAVAGLSFFGDEGSLILAGEEGLRRWDPGEETPRLLTELRNFSSLACRAALCLLGRPGGRIFSWSEKGLRELPKMPADGEVKAVALHPSGRLAAVAAGKDLFFYDLEAERLLGRLPPFERRITALAFEPLRGLLLLADEDGDLEIWDPRSRARIARPASHHDKAILHLAPSPEGRYFASGDLDGKVVVWTYGATPQGAAEEQLGEPQVLRELRAEPVSPIRGLAFDAALDLIVAYRDRAELFVFEPRRVLGAACRRARLELEADDWRRLVGQGIAKESACPAKAPGPR